MNGFGIGEDFDAASSRWLVCAAMPALLPLAVGTGARIDKAPAAGDYVEVRGRVGEGAVVELERLRRR